MDYNNSRYFGLNKNILSFLHHVALLAMLHSSFVAPAQGMLEAYIHKGESVAALGNGYYKNTDTDVATAQNTTQTQQAYPKYDVTGAKANSAYNINSYKFNADIKEGIIGVSKDKPLDSPSDNLFKVNLGQLPTGYDKVYLTYEVYGVADHHSVARSINDRLSVGGYLVKKQQGWSLQKEEIDAAWLKTGENTVLFTIPNGADYQYKIRNLSIAVEKSDETNSLLVIHNRELVVTKDNKLYIKGFLRGNHPDGKIEAGGTFLQVSNSEFEGYIPLTEDIKKNKFLVIKSTDKNDLLGQELLFIDNLIEADRIFPIERKEEAASKLFKAGTASRFDIEGAAIIANDRALAKDYDILISRLRNIDVAPMESGMINVTKGGKGYRFLPDGAKFEKPVSLSIAYDSLLIPTGYTAKDIKTYYFDTNSKRWVAVHKDSIDAKNNAIISKTTHFTDYINGIIQAPDSPETSAFAPTMMSDIKAADPSAEMTLISPPSASQKGDANISYPIKIPAGRNGLQPQLALQYSSAGGDSWLGQGWGLNIPAITLDTRWGAPLFDTAKETELYTLNGEQLIYPDGYLPHRHQDGQNNTLTTEMQNRNTSGSKNFYPRKQGSFAKIERLGTSPSTYYWRVTGTDGTVYWYGGREALSADHIIKDGKNPQNIVHWALYMIEDVYGNNIKYFYQAMTLGNTVTQNPGVHTGRFFEIAYIFYTGKDGVNGNYRIDFERETTIVREDVTIDARLGVKRVWPYRLKNILVNYLPDTQNPLIRKYSINYETGKLRKSRPASITESSGDGLTSYTHTFEYYNDITQDGVDVYFGSGINTSICIEGESVCPDTDNDGVCNSADACPDVFGPPSNNGCPEPEMEHCFRVSFKYYENKPIHIKINGIELPNSPYAFPQQYNQLISDINMQYGYSAQITAGNPMTLFITGTGYTLSSITTYFDLDPNNFAVTNLPFNDCMGGKPGSLTTFSTPSGSGNSYLDFYDQIKNNFTIDFDGSFSGGNPDCPWLVNYDFLMQGYMPSFISAPAALGSSKSESYSFGGYVGVGVGGNPGSKPTTLGGQYTYGWDKGMGYVASIDITGDGLEDIVMREDDKLYYKKHVVTRTYDAENNETVTHSFEIKRPIQGMNNFYRTNSETNSFNFQVTVKAVPVGGFAALDNSNTKSETDIYFTDANGDGLMDIVRNEVVYFNYIDNGVPRFEPDSWKTENLVITAKPKEIDIPAEYLEQEINYPKHDIVKVWEAPANGTIKITNNIELTDTSKEAVVTIEMAASDCQSVTFPIPSGSFYKYEEPTGVYNMFGHSIMGNTNCFVSSDRLHSFIVNGNTYDFTQYNIFLIHGDNNNNPTYNRCPAGPLTTAHNTAVKNPFSDSKTINALNTLFNSLSIPIYNVSSNHEAFAWIDPAGKAENVTQPHFEFYSPIVMDVSFYNQRGTFDNLVTNSVFSWDAYLGLNTPLTQSGPITLPVNTAILVNNAFMGSYNLTNNFNAFKINFENQYPGSIVTFIPANGSAPASIEITTDDFGLLDVKVIPSSSNNISNTYTFNPCGSTIAPRLADWSNLVLEKEQINYGITKWLADGNELKKPINKPKITSTFNLGQKVNGGITGQYSIIRDGVQDIWQNVNGEVVTDIKTLQLLNAALPKEFNSNYLKLVEESEQNEIIRRKEAYQEAIIELQQYGSQTQNQYSIYSINQSTCAYEPENLCLLFGSDINSGNSHITNTLTNFSPDCGNNKPLYVKKGDKIYFRVHSITEGNAKINWNPIVEYTNPNLTSVVDQNGETPFSSQYSDGFVLSGGSPVVFPGNGTAQISWPTFSVSNPSDDVTYEIYKKELTGPEENYNAIQPILIYQRKCYSGSTVTVSSGTNQISGSNIGNIEITNSSTDPQSTKVTLFYFKVTSTSNVKWKQWQWRPKVICITENTIIDENQSSQGIATFNDVRYPIPDYSIYKSFPCSSRYNLYDLSSLNSGSNPLSIMPTLNGISFNGLKGKLHFVVKRDGHLVDKRTFEIDNNNVNIDNNSPISLSTGSNEIEIGYYSDDSGLIDIEESLLSRLSTSGQPLAEITYTAIGSVIAQLYKQNINLLHKPLAKFGPMYRQWGQFAYNPAGVTDAVQSAYGPLIKEEKLMLTDENSQALQDAAAAAEAQFANVNLDTDYQSFIDNMNQFESNNQQLFNVPFIPLTANRNLSPDEGYQEKWQGLHAESYAGETTYRAATMDQAYTGMDDGDEETEQDVLKTGAYAITRYSTGEGTNLSGGASFGAEGSSASVSVNGSKSINGSSNMLTDYVDLNGDRYPDIVSTTHIQYTTKTGGLTDSDEINAAYNNNLADYGNSSWGIGASGSVVVGGKPASAPDPTIKRPQFSSFKGNNSVGISGNYSSGNSHTKKMWVDINGDGMADLLTRDALTGYVTVKMNLGDSRLAMINGVQTPWASFKLAEGRSSAGGGGIGGSLWNGSIEFGASINKGNNHTDFSLTDMNSDGLVDLVTSQDDALKVRLNRGGNFAPEITWSNYNLDRQYEVVSMGKNAGGTLAWIFGIPFTSISLKLIDVNVNGSPYSTSTNNTKKTITDYDGDGYPDLLEEISSGTVRIRPSNIRRTDMLKSVTNPLGGKFTVDYKVITPSYENPNSKWVMTDVIVEDGYDIGNDGYDTYKKKYEYIKPKYDRREREFYGFETVKSIDYKLDSEGEPIAVYRRSETKYHNNSYFLNGFEIENILYQGGSATQIFSKSVNTYAIRLLDSDGYINFSEAVQPLTFDTGGREGRRAAAALLTKTQKYIYELGSTPLVTEMNIKYNKYGAVTEYIDSGSADPADDYRTQIIYHDDPALLSNNMVAIPKQVNVYDVATSTLMRKRVSEVNVATGDISKITVALNNSQDAVTNIEYDSFGNLKKVTLPPNHNSESMFYNYTYDTENKKYPVSVQDAFSYTSTSSYNPKFDKVLVSTDIAGNSVINAYDNFGRLITVQGPKEIEAGIPYTIKFNYYPQFTDMLSGLNCVTAENFVPMAVTSHYDMHHPSNDIETITLVDGLARTIQVKKDIEMNIGGNEEPSYEERMAVSGMVTYDEFGRAVRQYHLSHESKVCSINYIPNLDDTVYYAETIFDEVDRPKQVNDPDGNASYTVYSLGQDLSGSLAMKTLSIVDNDNDPVTNEVYKDIRGKVTYTKNVLMGTSAQDIWTEFKYNAIGEMISYTDAKGLATTYKYDLAGRKTEIVHPDNGKTNYEYDQAGNLIRLQTANLLADNSLPSQDQYIKYLYYYNRLTEITYPPMPGGNNISNVYYVYGESGNQKGRLEYQRDATGEQFFGYGNMGEMIWTKRFVIGPNIPTRLFNSYYSYDSWNRVKSITYPDNEKVNYAYDLGGNLSKVSGTVNGDPYDYVSRIDYDHFEQRTFIKYGNNTFTAYEYDASLRRLEYLNAKTASNEYFLKNEYSYDKVGNITKLHNTATPNSYNGMGGGFLNTYGYDNLNRLITSDGSFSGDAGSQQPLNNDYSSDYHLDMEYDNTYGITMKKQDHYKNGQPVQENFMISNYSYPQDSHKLEILQNQVTGITEQFVYDSNGNLVYLVNTNQGTAKMHTWDESNRLRAVTDDYSMQHYIYDASGERVLKGSAQPEQLYNNGTPVDGDMSFDAYTTYPSPYIVVNGDGQFSKHYYAGSQRIVSRVSEDNASIFETPAPRPSTAATQGGEDKEAFSEDKLRKLQVSDLTQILAKAKKGIPVFKKYNPEDKNDDADTDDGKGKGDGFVQKGPSQVTLYFYHPDHLGSSTYLTDANGELYQFFLNLPFGETMAEQHSLTQDYQTPYKFNGKELDRETGYYYYGARYYNPRISIWLSTDPLMEKYPNINPYTYCLQNPVLYTDPTGMSVDENNDIIDINVKTGHTKITKAEGNDIVRLMDKDKVVDQYVYGKNGSFDNDTTIDSAADEITGRSVNQYIHFSGDANKADKFYKFAAKSDVEFGLIEIFYGKSGYGETIVSTDHKQYSVGSSNYAYGLLDMYEDAIVTRLSHSHPGPFGIRSFHPAVPSGFDTATLKPENRGGDRTNYDKGNKYKDRRPAYYEVYIPGNPKVKVTYNGEKAIRTFK